MKPEERLFDLMGELPDEVLSQTDAPKQQRRALSPKQRNRWIGMAVAACLVVAFGVWGMTYKPPYLREDFPKSSTSLGLPDQTSDTPDQTSAHGPELSWPRLDGVHTEMSLRFSILPVGDRVADYHQVNNPNGIPEEQRPRYLGESYRDLEGWYLPEENTGLRYLIHEEEDGSYTLWEFSSFAVFDQPTLDQMERDIEQGNSPIWTQTDWFRTDMDFSPYSYGEVLETIYGAASAEDLVSVTVEPSTADNTDAGKALQREIGTHIFTDRDSLDILYNALVNMICYGDGNWDMIDLGDSDEEGGLLHSVRLSRYLTIELADGSAIDSLKYTANSSRFYEFSGILYAPLDADTAAKMNELFKIET